jgi:hypothetical protein
MFNRLIPQNCVTKQRSPMMGICENMAGKFLLVIFMNQLPPRTSGDYWAGNTTRLFKWATVRTYLVVVEGLRQLYCTITSPEFIRGLVFINLYFLLYNSTTTASLNLIFFSLIDVDYMHTIMIFLHF